MRTKPRRFNRYGLFPLFALLVITGCGDDLVGGAGQCGGADKTGICLAVVSIVPEFEDEELFSVDAYQDLDCDRDFLTDDNPRDDEELFTAHTAVVEFSAFNLIPTNAPLDPPGVPGFVTVTEYTVEYISDVGNVEPVPPLTTRVFNQTILIETGGTFEFEISLVDDSQKTEFRAFSGSRPERDVRGDNNIIYSYTARFVFRGVDMFANPVSATGLTKFEMGNFDACDL